VTAARLLRTAALAALPALAAAHCAPAVSTFGPLRNRTMPRLSGRGRPDHIALTFDDYFWAPAYATMRSVCLTTRRRADLVFACANGTFRGHHCHF